MDFAHFEVKPVAGGIMLAIAKTFSPQEAIQIGTELIGAAYMTLGMTGAATMAAIAAPMGLPALNHPGAPETETAEAAEATRRKRRTKAEMEAARAAETGGASDGEPTTADEFNAGTEQPLPATPVQPDPGEFAIAEKRAQIRKALAANLSPGWEVEPALSEIVRSEIGVSKLEKVGAAALDKLLRLVSDRQYVAFHLKPMPPAVAAATSEQTAALNAAMAAQDEGEIPQFAEPSQDPLGAAI